MWNHLTQGDMDVADLTLLKNHSFIRGFHGNLLLLVLFIVGTHNLVQRDEISAARAAGLLS